MNVWMNVWMYECMNECMNEWSIVLSCSPVAEEVQQCEQQWGLHTWQENTVHAEGCSLFNRMLANDLYVWCKSALLNAVHHYNSSKCADFSPTQAIMLLCCIPLRWVLRSWNWATNVPSLCNLHHDPRGKGAVRKDIHEKWILVPLPFWRSSWWPWRLCSGCCPYPWCWPAVSLGPYTESYPPGYHREI